jgi:hypothetical protein
MTDNNLRMKYLLNMAHTHHFLTPITLKGIKMAFTLNWLNIQLKVYFHQSKFSLTGEAQWLTPVIPATQEAEIGRIMVQSYHSRQKASKTNKPGAHL